MRKKEYLVTFILFSFFVFIVFLSTGTITSGWHLVDDHEFVRYGLYMNSPDGSLLSCIKNVLQTDFASRFRPLYHILRISATAVLGTNLVAWSVLKGGEAVLALFLLYICARQLR